MRWFTADLHLGHTGVLKWRPQFSTLDEMHGEIIKRWNDVVSDSDEVWVLGDVALRWSALPLMDSLKGTKHLVAGNHDACHPRHHDHAKRLHRYLQHFESVHLMVESDDIVLSHFPYSGDHTREDRFAEWRPVDEGKILLHGHVHDAWCVKGRQINVGVDVWDFAPVTAEWASTNW